MAGSSNRCCATVTVSPTLGGQQQHQARARSAAARPNRSCQRHTRTEGRHGRRHHEQHEPAGRYRHRLADQIQRDGEQSRTETEHLGDACTAAGEPGFGLCTSTNGFGMRVQCPPDHASTTTAQAPRRRARTRPMTSGCGTTASPSIVAPNRSSARMRPQSNGILVPG